MVATIPSFGRNPASLTTSLSKLNQSLEQRYIKEKKKISAADFRALRARLNVEVSSAQSLNDRENEIFKLLSYSTYAVYLTKKSDQIKTLKSFWNKLFHLPIDSDVRALPDDFFGELRKPQNYYDYIHFLEFYTDFFPQDNLPIFVFDFIRTKCEFYSEFRVEKKFYPCLKQLEPLTKIRPVILNSIANYELNYLSRSKQNYVDFLKVASQNFQVFSKRSTIHTITLIASAIYEALEGNISQGKAYLEEVKNTIPGSPIISAIEASLLFAQGDFNNAKKTFALLVPPETERDKNARYYYSLGASIDVGLNEYESAVRKLEKHMEITKTMPLHGLRTHLSLLTLQALSGTLTDVKAHQELIRRYESIISKLKLQDPYLKVSLKIMKNIIQTTPLTERMPHLKVLHNKLAAHELKFSLPLFLLSKLVGKDSNNLSVPATTNTPTHEKSKSSKTASQRPAVMKKPVIVEETAAVKKPTAVEESTTVAEKPAVITETPSDDGGEDGEDEADGGDDEGDKPSVGSIDSSAPVAEPHKDSTPQSPSP